MNAFFFIINDILSNFWSYKMLILSTVLLFLKIEQFRTSNKTQ